MTEVCGAKHWERNALGRPYQHAVCGNDAGHPVDKNHGHWDGTIGFGWNYDQVPMPEDEGHVGTITRRDDPAHVLLEDPNVKSTKPGGVYDGSCYICTDPEFAAMGLPLCQACPQCTEQNGGIPTGHVPADDCECTVCGWDAQEAWALAEEKKRLEEDENIRPSGVDNSAPAEERIDL